MLYSLARVRRFAAGKINGKMCARHRAHTHARCCHLARALVATPTVPLGSCTTLKGLRESCAKLSLDSTGNHEALRRRIANFFFAHAFIADVCEQDVL